MFHAQLARLRPRNLVVLAERAEQIAAVAADGKDERSRMKMAERLLLDWVESDGRELAVIRAGNFAADIRPRCAEARLPFRELAVMRTEAADHAMFFHRHTPGIDSPRPRLFRRRWVSQARPPSDSGCCRCAPRRRCPSPRASGTALPSHADSTPAGRRRRTCAG